MGKFGNENVRWGCAAVSHKGNALFVV